MDIITCNPYRTLGVLVNASAREKERQVRQLKQYLEAEQQPPQGDYSFPVFGKVNRTLEDVTDAVSKLNLDGDKMNAALFWFWKDNEITDEAAFEALKDGDINAAWQIWDKLVVETETDGKRYWKEVTNKNCSAFHNWSIATFLHNGNNSLQKAIYANLTFLESDFRQKLKEQVTDNTYRISKKELQLMFLNSIVAEDKVNASDLVKIIKDIDFSAKQDFLKSIAQKFIKNITAQIECAAKKRKESAINAAIAGENLYRQTQADLKQLKEIFDTADFSYSNVADKVANEVLQCSIDFFNDCQDKELDNNYPETAMKLAKWAQGIAVGNVVKGRIKENLQTMEEMKDKEIQQAIALLQSIKDAYDNAYAEIVKMAKKQLGIYDEEEYIEIGGKSIKIPRIQPISFPFETRTINYSAVEESARKSINWDKVVEILQKAITLQNIDKIKNVRDTAKINEYKMLVNFVFEKLSSYQKSKVSYINWWTTVPSPISTKTRSNSSTSIHTPPKKESWASENSGCVVMIMAIIITFTIIINL